MCNRQFADPTCLENSLELLKAERERFRGLESDQARKAFVSAGVPIQQKHKHKKHQRVCGRFFKAVFPVSNNVIYAAKGTPGARKAQATSGRSLKLY